MPVNYWTRLRGLSCAGNSAGTGSAGQCRRGGTVRDGRPRTGADGL